MHINIAKKLSNELSKSTMAKIRLMMDTRRENADGRYPVRIAISKNGSTVYISSGIFLSKEEWIEKDQRVIKHSNKNLLNQRLRNTLLNVEKIDLEAQMTTGYSQLSASDIKQMCCPKTEKKSGGDFYEYYKSFAERKNPSTMTVYLGTLSRISAYIGDEGLHALKFSDINYGWLTEFNNYLLRTSPSGNARGIHFRNIRACFNAALDDEKISNYPFRKFKIPKSKTAKRNLKVEKLRELFSYPCEEYQCEYIDMFKLIFFLRGINLADLSRLETISDGRIEYVRAKTHKPYSVKVEPEAIEIINRYRGQGYLLNILDRNNSHYYYAKHMNKALQSIGDVKRKGLGGKKELSPAFPGLTVYWARHSWATIASSLDVPKEVIALGLGHGGNTVTDIYIEPDMAKVDRANRLVIDHVLYGSKETWH